MLWDVEKVIELCQVYPLSNYNDAKNKGDIHLMGITQWIYRTHSEVIRARYT